jgi:penicillin-binding protein-related factor A (putative recombinase)
MKSKEWEEVVLYRMRQEEEHGRCSMGRYGVQGSFSKGQPIDVGEWVTVLREAAETGHLAKYIPELISAAKASADGWRPLQSLPDFEGVLSPRGRQFVLDAKVCNQPSFPLDTESKSKSRQLKHMLTRAKFGAVCFYLIHFPERTLARSIEPAQSYAFPIHPDHKFWESFDRGESKRITRADCEEYGVAVIWNTLPGGRTPRPDVLAAVYELIGRLPGSASPSTPSIELKPNRSKRSERARREHQAFGANLTSAVDSPQ